MLSKKELVDFLKDVPDDFEIYFFPENMDDFEDENGKPIEIRSHLVYVDPSCRQRDCYPTFIANINTIEIIPYRESEEE